MANILATISETNANFNLFAGITAVYAAPRAKAGMGFKTLHKVADATPNPRKLYLFLLTWISSLPFEFNFAYSYAFLKSFVFLILTAFPPFIYG